MLSSAARVLALPGRAQFRGATCVPQDQNDSICICSVSEPMKCSCTYHAVRWGGAVRWGLNQDELCHGRDIDNITAARACRSSARFKEWLYSAPARLTALARPPAAPAVVSDGAAPVADQPSAAGKKRRAAGVHSGGTGGGAIRNARQRDSHERGTRVDVPPTAPSTSGRLLQASTHEPFQSRAPQRPGKKASTPTGQRPGRQERARQQKQSTPTPYATKETAPRVGERLRAPQVLEDPDKRPHVATQKQRHAASQQRGAQSEPRQQQQQQQQWGQHSRGEGSPPSQPPAHAGRHGHSQQSPRQDQHKSRQYNIDDLEDDVFAEQGRRRQPRGMQQRGLNHDFFSPQSWLQAGATKEINAAMRAMGMPRPSHVQAEAMRAMASSALPSACRVAQRECG